MTLEMKTNIGRDILQSAQGFRTIEGSVWEYLVNSLQYVDPGVTPNVDIVLDRKKGQVVIADNGRGMDRQKDSDGVSELEHFFTMHGENRQRRAGVRGRGKFGTGKSAAFGIGTELRVDTVRNGKRNAAVLTVEDVKKATGATVPVKTPVVDEVASAPNGTVITISGVDPKKMNVPAMRTKFARLVASFRHADPKVVIDGETLVLHEIAKAQSFKFEPHAELRPLLGDITLMVHQAQQPLTDPEDRGVAITVGSGNLVAREDGGVAGKEFGNYLFGEVDVPNLDDDKYGPEAPYGTNRDLKLNNAHKVAAALVAFIGMSLEDVRQALLAEYKSAKRAAEMMKLKALAEELSTLINEDFAEQAERLEASTPNAKKRSKAPGSAGSDAANDDNPDYKTADEGDPDAVTGEGDGTLYDSDPKHNDPNPNPEPNPDLGPDDHGGGDPSAQAGTPSEDGAEHVKPTPAAGSKKPRGGIRVEYEDLGADDYRSKYDQERSVITINLNHPVVAAAYATDGDTNAPAFRRLSAEITFSEYAQALARLEYTRNPEVDGDDLLFEVRSTLNRISGRAVTLYS